MGNFFVEEIWEGEVCIIVIGGVIVVFCEVVMVGEGVVLVCFLDVVEEIMLGN